MWLQLNGYLVTLCLKMAAYYKIIDKEPERCAEFMEANTNGKLGGAASFIGLEQNGKLIACVGYDRYMPKRSIHMHIFKLPDARLIKEYLWFVFYYPFMQLKLNCVMGFVEQGSQAELVAVHAGFERRCRIDETGMNLMVLNKHNCRYINGWK